MSIDDKQQKRGDVEPRRKYRPDYGALCRTFFAELRPQRQFERQQAPQHYRKCRHQPKGGPEPKQPICWSLRSRFHSRENGSF